MSKSKNVLDVLFVIDSTNFMDTAIKAIRDVADGVLNELESMNRRSNIRFGIVGYRDPADVPSDKNDVFDFDPEVESFVDFLGGLKALGGGDIPEDYVAALEVSFEKLSWRGGKKAIVWITDAPAHGERYCGLNNHQEQEGKLEPLVKRLANDGICFSGLSINGGADKTFQEMKKIYDNEGGKSFVFKAFNTPKGGEARAISSAWENATREIVTTALK